MEIWDSYDENEIRTGETYERGQRLPLGRYHLVCEVLVRHKDGDYLLMRRSPCKKVYPNCLEATAGGSALVGEGPIDCIKRELFEECGIPCEEFVRVGHIFDVERRAIFHSFICTVDCDKESVRLQDGETCGYLWVGEKEFISYLNSPEVIPTQKERYTDYFKKIGYIE